GATLYFLTTRRPPYQGPSFAHVMAQLERGDLVPPRRLCPEMDPALDTVIIKALQSDPARRYQTAAELAEELGALLEGRPIRARPARLIERMRRGLWRWRAAAVAGSLVLGSLTVAGIFRERMQAQRRASVEALREVAHLSLEDALRLRRAGDT